MFINEGVCVCVCVCDPESTVHDCECVNLCTFD